MIRPTTIREKLLDLVLENVAEINDSYTEEMLTDMMEDPAYIEESIDDLIEVLESIKEEGL